MADLISLYVQIGFTEIYLSTHNCNYQEMELKQINIILS